VSYRITADRARGTRTSWGGALAVPVGSRSVRLWALGDSSAAALGVSDGTAGCCRAARSGGAVPSKAVM
jgi:hypothetical protein